MAQTAACYQRLFSDAPELRKSREHYALTENTLPSRERRVKLTHFFFVTIAPAASSGSCFNLAVIVAEIMSSGTRSPFPVRGPVQGLNSGIAATSTLLADDGGIAMNVLFNNPLLYVIDYPGHDALEILDKRNGRMGLLRGATADRMRGEFRQFLAQEHDQEEFEDFIDSYEAILDHPVSRH